VSTNCKQASVLPYVQNAITNFSSESAIQGIVTIEQISWGRKWSNKLLFGLSAGRQRSSRRLPPFSLNFPWFDLARESISKRQVNRTYKRCKIRLLFCCRKQTFSLNKRERAVCIKFCRITIFINIVYKFHFIFGAGEQQSIRWCLIYVIIPPHTRSNVLIKNLWRSRTV